jgi:hypothetical protein
MDYCKTIYLFGVNSFKFDSDSGDGGDGGGDIHHLDWE